MPLPLVINPGDLGHLTHHETIHDLLNPIVAPFDDVAHIDSGLRSARPAAGVAGRIYYATDMAVGFLDTGSGWVPLGNRIDLEHSFLTSSQAVSTSSTDLTGTTLNITTYDTNARYYAVATFFFSIVASGYGTAEGTIAIDGGASLATTAAISIGIAGVDASAAATHSGTIASAGAHTFRLRTRKTNSGGTINVANAQLSVIVVEGSVT